LAAWFLSTIGPLALARAFPTFGSVAAVATRSGPTADPPQPAFARTMQGAEAQRASDANVQ
jgi:hypothetical protein